MKSILQNVKKRVGGGGTAASSASPSASPNGGGGGLDGGPGGGLGGNKGPGGLAPPSVSTGGEDGYFPTSTPSNMSPTSGAAHGEEEEHTHTGKQAGKQASDWSVGW